VDRHCPAVPKLADYSTGPGGGRAQLPAGGARFNRSAAGGDPPGADIRPSRAPRAGQERWLSTLTFLGAAGTVTGTRLLLETSQARILLDCGLFQGLKELRQRNWNGQAARLATVDAIVLSHAHLDHSGYLPRLVKAGYRGPVFATPPTIDLLGLVLPDAAYLQEEEAAYANRKGYSRHRPALPLFTVDDALAALRLLRPVDYQQSKRLPGGITVRLRDAGHLLGSATLTLDAGGRRLVYSGDLGRYGGALLNDPAPVEYADVLVMESTYGNTLRRGDPLADLAAAIAAAEARGGVLLIPAFALGRTQDLLYGLARLARQGRLPGWPIYVDSPMAIDATSIFHAHPAYHRPELPNGDLLHPPGLIFARTQADSRRLNELEHAAIIISASGMATGGRVLHHLSRRLPDPRTVVLFAGYQAPGTRGRALVDGAAAVKMFGEYIPVRAEIRHTDAFSAHADQAELLRWLAGFERPPARIALVHGEPPALAGLAAAIRQRFGWTAAPAEDGQTIELGERPRRPRRQGMVAD
jgi:metallo-beta-lactamase family protein